MAHIIDGGTGGSQGDHHVFSAWLFLVGLVRQDRHRLFDIGGFSLPFLLGSPQNMNALLAKFIDNIVCNGVLGEVLVHAGHHHDRCVS